MQTHSLLVSPLLPTGAPQVSTNLASAGCLASAPEQALHEAMRASPNCYWLEMSEAARIELLLQDYGHFKLRPEAFCALLEILITLRGREKVLRWQTQALTGDWAAVFGELMREHYDPGYERSLRGHYPQLDQAQRLNLVDGGQDCMTEMARQLHGHKLVEDQA